MTVSPVLYPGASYVGIYERPARLPRGFGAVAPADSCSVERAVGVARTVAGRYTAVKALAG